MHYGCNKEHRKCEKCRDVHCANRNHIQYLDKEDYKPMDWVERIMDKFMRKE